MREIKFRVWDREEKRIINFDELIERNTIMDYLDEYIAVFQELIGEYDSPRIYMQYTGLKDKYGVEIYEGDILKAYNGINYSIVVIRFGEYSQDGSGGEYNPVDCMGFYAEKNRVIPNKWDYFEEEGEWFIYDPEYEKSSSILFYDYLELIGNIYENPELLSL